MAKYQKYPEYKDSGVEWLGKVPDYWKVKVLKRDLSLLTEKTNRRINSVALENIEGWTGRFIRTNTDFQGEGVAFDKGDILFGKLRPYLAKALLAELAGEAVGDFHVMHPEKNVHGAFIQYQILTPSFIDLVNGSTFGAKMPRASWEFVSNMNISYPPLPEQIQIAKFLDHETGKIDRLIEKQQELIALLKEKRQAVISHAVTKGLNPKAPLKPSGIEWLGDVPEHWETTKIKYVAQRIVDCPHETPKYDPEGKFDVIRTADINCGHLDLSATYKLDELEYKRRIRREPLLPKDILYSREGERWGHAVIVPDSPLMCLGQRMMQFRLWDSENPEFFMYALNSRSVYEQGAVDIVGATAPHINISAIRNFGLNSPPLDEQQAIAEKLVNELSKIDILVLKAQDLSSLFQERRTALISAAVTGKIDVRDWEAPAANDE